MQTDSTTYRTLKNVSYSFMGYVWPIVFAIFVTPFIVFRLGVSNYGFYILLNTVNAILGLLDLGVATAFVKYVSEYNGAGDRQGLKRLIGAANLIFIAVGGVGLAVMIIIGLASYGRMGLDMSLEVYFSYFLVAGLIFFVNSLASVFVSIPTALQRLDISNQLGMVRLLLLNVVIVIALLMGGGLMSVLLAYLGFDLLFLVINIGISRRLVPDVNFLPAWHYAEIKKCYRFGLGYFVSSWASQLLYHLDRLIIPFLLGPAQLAYYSLPGNVATKVQGLNNSLSTVIFPMSSAFQGSGDKDRLRKVYIRSSRLLVIVAAGFTTAVIPFAHSILLYWLDADFAEKSSKILVILSLTYFMLALASPLNGFLLGLGKVRVLAYFSTSMTLINAVCLWFLLPRYGIEGAAWAYLISVLPTAALFYYTEKKVLGLENRLPDYLKLGAKNLLCMVLVYSISRYLLIGLVGSLWTLLVMFGLAIALYFVLYAGLGFFEHEDWVTFRDFFRSIMKKTGNLWPRTQA